jgi:alkylhydroperoxidase/carboxymuconolactone decarboxylase family protein YurZ
MAMAEEETPILDALADLTAVSVERSTLDPRELMLARIAALAAVDAPAASYFFNASTAMDVGITSEDIQGILIAVAPIVGTPRIVAATGNLASALGFALELTEAMAEAEAEAEG